MESIPVCLSERPVIGNLTLQNRLEAQYISASIASELPEPEN
jgi:hypothetical protein